MTGQKLKISDQLDAIKSNVVILYNATFDPRTPWQVRCLVFFIIAYILSPIDIIPDFIPVIGLLDEVILVPFLMHQAFTMIPENLKLEYFQSERELKLPPAKIGMLGSFIVFMFWGVTVLIAWWLIFKT